MEKFLAHPKEEEEPGLIQHSIKVARIARELASRTNLETPAFYAGLLHDLGKLNPYYQNLFTADKETRQALETQLQTEYLRGHSILSALASYRLLGDNQTGEKEKQQVLLTIASHHSHLRQLYKIMGNYEQADGGYNQKFSRSLTEMNRNAKTFLTDAESNPELRALHWKNLIENFSIPNFSRYAARSQDYVREYLEFCLVFSTLLQADRGSFFNWHSPLFDLHLNTETLIKSGRLEDLRNKFQQKIFSDNEFRDRVMVLEAPTGIGKTKILLDLIEKLTSSERFERVFYFSPLLALTDDFESKLYDASNPSKSVIAAEELSSVLSYNHVYVGSLESKLTRNESQEEEQLPDFFKTREYFETESFNRKLIITTTQRLLYIIYSNSVSDKIKLLSFKNSILVLDEVQTIPKFLLPNLITILKLMAETMNSQIILVSATVPNQIKNTVNTINYPFDLKRDYLLQTIKNIHFKDPFDMAKEARTFSDRQRILIITNTRRKALTLFESVAKTRNDVTYISAGIRKRTRREMIAALRGRDPAIVISTQVMEAGVDISFDRLYREVGPLDSIVQAMGRLNREAETSDPATMIVFRLDSDWLPYSQLEFEESLHIIKMIRTSQELYAKLPEYYNRIDEKNQKNKRLAQELEHKTSRLEFDEIWNFIFKKVLSEDSRGSVLIPSPEEWEEVKEYYSRRGNKPRRGKHNPYADLMAELPKTPAELRITDLFDQELMENGILLPKKDCISKLYNEKTGLDELLKQH